MSINKGAIQKFAIWARKELLAQVSQRAYQYGITKDGYGAANAETVFGRALDCDEQKQRRELVDQVRSKGYAQVIEEVAYTWFNRFIALRFMEVNNYLPSHIRVFSDSTGAFKPEILNGVLHLDLPGLSREKVAAYIESNETERLYRYLLLTQCNALNDSLPRMFEKMGGYTELLLPNNILRQDGVLGHMVADIPEEDWKEQVQIIGWLYQYYNSELNAVVYDGKMSKCRIPKELLPAATTIYTPDWAIRYMMENSLGRLWLEGHPNDDLKVGWKYYLEEAMQEPEAEAQLAMIREEYKTIKLDKIKVIDPCVGSGHILVYAFDLLMQIYETLGYSQRDAAQSIIENNLYGLDIDDRAAQLAYFAVMMKARQYDRRIFSRRIQPNIYAICESNGVQAITVEYFHKKDPKLKSATESIVIEMRDAKEYGSILNITPVDFARLYDRFDEIRTDGNILKIAALDELLPLVKCVELMVQKYDVVVTNPPYLGSSRFSTKLNVFVIANYTDVKSDLSMVMYKHALRDMCKKNGFVSFITTTSWMFLSSFEKLRRFVLEEYDFESIVDFGTELFDGKVGHNPIVAWVNRKSHTDHAMTSIRLVDYCYSRRDAKVTEFFNKQNYYYPKQSNFSKIPGSPIAYWVSEQVISIFEALPLSDYASPKQGLATGNNDKFLRLWYEVSFTRVGLHCTNRLVAKDSKKKWFPCNKGGAFRKWYGNLEYVVNWENDGFEIRNFYDENGKQRSRPQNMEYYFKKGITWSTISSGQLSMRYSEVGTMFETKGSECFFDDNKNLEIVLGAVNTKVVMIILTLLCPTLDFHEGPIGKIPIIMPEKKKEERLRKIVNDNVGISRVNWDSFETSWDFKRHPLV